MSLPLQDVLEGKYEILEKIGEGGIGAVYKVRHRLLEEVRVIKVLRPQAASKEDLRRRFLHEARMAIRLKHPNIAQLHDFSIAEDDRAYIVMEYIDGVGLDALLEAAGPPSVELVLEISQQALAALHYLHENQFVHRDVSPDNLMLTTSFDGGPLVKLIDLGIARHLGAEARLTATGVFLGKARYCSPEQFSAGGETATEVDRRGDIYSFGVMLYELLTGVYPFAGDSFAELAGSHLFQPPKAFAETDPLGQLPEGLRAAVLRALEKSPDDRFDTAAGFAAELARFRDPEASFQEEFDRTVEVTTAALPKIQAGEKPGSTQDRLNREFGIHTTPSPDRRLADELRGETVIAEPGARLEETVRRIEDLLARGRQRRAARLLEQALPVHGEVPALEDLRRRLAAAPPRRRGGTAVLLGAAALGAVVAALAVWWWPARSAAPEPAATPASPMAMAPAPRWDPAASTDSLPLVWETPPDAALADSGEALAAETVGSEQPPPPTPPRGDRARPAADAAPPAVKPSPRAADPVPPQVSLEIFAPAVGVVPPVLVELPRPTPPPGGRRLREPLVVIVEVLVDETGKVLTARVGEVPSFRRRYRDAALEVAQAARFRPARKGNLVGRMWTELHITFEPE